MHRTQLWFNKRKKKMLSSSSCSSSPSQFSNFCSVEQPISPLFVSSISCSTVSKLSISVLSCLFFYIYFLSPFSFGYSTLSVFDYFMQLRQWTCSSLSDCRFLLLPQLSFTFKKAHDCNFVFYICFLCVCLFIFLFALICNLLVKHHS